MFIDADQGCDPLLDPLNAVFVYMRPAELYSRLEPLDFQGYGVMCECSVMAPGMIRFTCACTKGVCEGVFVAIMNRDTLIKYVLY